MDESRLTQLEREMSDMKEAIAEHRTTLFGAEGRNGMNQAIKDLKEGQEKLFKHFWMGAGALAVIMYVIQHYDIKLP